MDIGEQAPKWQMELLSFKGIKSTFIIEGNVNDLYPFFEKIDAQSGLPDEPCLPIPPDQYALTGFSPLNRLLGGLFSMGETENAYELLFCDPLSGFSDPLSLNRVKDIVGQLEDRLGEKKKEAQAMNCSPKAENHTGSKMIANSELIRVSMTVLVEKNRELRKSFVNIVDYASRFVASPDSMSIDEITFFLNLQYASKNALRVNKFINTLILVVDKLNDVPAWFFLNNPNVRVINIPNPDRYTRLSYINQKLALNNEIFSAGIPEDKAVEVKNKFVDLTAGMKLREIEELLRLRDKSNIQMENIADVVAIYKYGFKENKWAQIKEKFTGDMHDEINKRVKGQGQAIDKIVRVIKRSVVGLSGLQHSSGTKPRGILFLAGPTGTGKTELVKAVTEMLFGDEKALIRFDMSEYTAENADQKLFGAPPGYVGYNNGGQLTNAVKNNPFSVLLFDEIEKAHPNIMDKFLQILEDGRMTDGQGNTVYFTETLIFFTSNVGISRERIDPATGKVSGRENIVSPGEQYDVIREKVEDAMRTHFKPEVINRIGENIAVFNYIDPSASREIARSQIERINANIKKENKVSIMIGGDALEFLYGLCLNEKTQQNGGRGIGNVVEEQYLNPLAEYIFDENCVENDTVIVSKTDGAALTFAKG